MLKHPAGFFLTFLVAGLLLFQSGCESLSVSAGRSREIRGILTQYQEAMNARSADRLFGLMADKVQVEGMTDELSRAGLRAGMHWTPSPIRGFQILSLSQRDGETDVKVGFKLASSMLLMRIGFDEALKIRTIDPVSVWKVPQAKVAKAFSSAFVENRGLMFVRAQVNNRTGLFLLDTGSSCMLLNKKYFLSDSQNELPGLTSTVAGIKQRLGSCTVRSFQWGELHAGGVRGQLHDFSAMETPAITPLLGAIGFEQLKSSAIAFDWANKKIDVRPGPGGAVESTRSPREIIAFSYFLHTPAFPVRVGDKTFRMIFDSGAQINLIPNLNGIEGHFRRFDGGTKISDGGQIGKDTALLGVIDETWIGNARYENMQFAVFEVPYLSGQGILGSPLMQKGLMEINFPKRTISFW